MLTYLRPLGLVLLLSLGTAQAQDTIDTSKRDKPTAKDEKTLKSVEFEVLFRDKSNLRLLILEPDFVLETKYGKLTVPFADVKVVRFGLETPADAKNGNNDEKQADELDFVEAGEFMLQGDITSSELQVRTKQFGESKLKVEQILSMKSISTVRSRGEIRLDAAKYNTSDWSSWYDTGIMVTQGEPLKIVAEGQIDHWPEHSRATNSPSDYTAGPEGNDKPTRMPSPGIAGGPAVTPTRLQSGMLVGRIGDRPTILPIGKAYITKSAPATGKLYLIITPTFWGKPAAGTFEVEVKAGN